MFESYILERDNDLQVVSVPEDNDPLYGMGSWNQLAGPMPLADAKEQASIILVEIMPEYREQLEGETLRSFWEQMLGVPCQVVAFIDRGFLCHAVWVVSKDYDLAYDAMILSGVDDLTTDLLEADTQFNWHDSWYRKQDGTSSIGW